MKLLGISALAGSGKNTFADVLVANGWCSMAFADPLKRFVQKVYGFSTESLWGSSELRNVPDKRYSVIGSDGTIEYLTPRKALQTLGDWGRALYLNTWVDMTMQDIKTLRADHLYGEKFYSPECGIVNINDGPFWKWKASKMKLPYKGFIVTDVRMRNEFDAVENAGGKNLRMRRKGIDEPAWDHISETEQQTIRDNEFAALFDNSFVLPEQMPEFEATVMQTVEGMWK